MIRDALEGLQNALVPEDLYTILDRMPALYFQLTPSEWSTYRQRLIERGVQLGFTRQEILETLERVMESVL